MVTVSPHSHRSVTKTDLRQPYAPPVALCWTEQERDLMGVSSTGEAAPGLVYNAERHTLCTWAAPSYEQSLRLN